jgi:4-diphosphocytidyl-2-C-methyl-D-erythritol kinase
MNFGQKIYIVLINPNIHILSKDAYKGSVANIFSPKIICDEHSITNEIFHGKNDLEEYVKREYPVIKELLNSIRCEKNCLVSRMSGSGSTCFGIFSTKEDALRATKNLSEIYPHFWRYAAF